MHKVLIVAALALTLAGCETARQDRTLGGAFIGGGAGAVAGGLIGAAAGAIIADSTRPGHCYYLTESGRRRYVRCR